MKPNKIKAMTLVELIVALAIFGIIVIAFLNLFFTGMMGIFLAGDKGKAYSLVQDDLDTRIARGESIETEDLSLIFNGVTYTIEGGLVESNKSVNNSSSNLEAFIPLVPTIGISPKTNYEGTGIPIVIDVTGRNTNFSASTTAMVLDKTGATVISNPSLTVSDSTHLTITLNIDLLNSESEYIIRLISPISGRPDEVVRAKYTLVNPNLIAISGESMYVSYNGTYWMERSNKSSYPSLVNLNDVLIKNGKYIAVGDNGAVLIYKNELGWIKKSITGSGDLLDVTWSNSTSKFYAVTSTGRIYESTNGELWTTVYTDASLGILNGINVTATGKIIAVGDSGSILTSTDGATWMKVITSGGENLNKVLAVDTGTDQYYIAVGDNGSIYRSTDLNAWNKVVITSTSNINGIKESLGQIVAVGEDGLILSSIDSGNSWSESYYGSGTVDLYDVDFLLEDDKIFIAGDGVILESTDMLSWVVSQSELGKIFTSIAGK